MGGSDSGGGVAGDRRKKSCGERHAQRVRATGRVINAILRAAGFTDFPFSEIVQSTE